MSYMIKTNEQGNNGDPAVFPFKEQPENDKPNSDHQPYREG